MLSLLVGCSKEDSTATQEIFTVERRALDITVLASGSVDTANPTNIIQRIGRTAKIISIVPEGTIITAEDIAAKRILVEFDKKDTEDKLYERQTGFENAETSAMTAEENLILQRQENESNIRTAKLEVIYAENDLKKLIGVELIESFHDKAPEDIAALLTDPRLGGQTLQDLTTYRSDIELAQTKLNRAIQTLEYTKKLYERQYVSKNDYENDQLEVQSQQKSLQATKGKYELYLKFDFVKTFQKTWATLQQAQDNLRKTEAQAKIRLAGMESRNRSAKQHLLQATKRLEEEKKALSNCIIYATVPGMVVYEKLPRWDNTGPIQPGKEIRNQQCIFRMPDLDNMLVKTTINESQIDLISEEQTATIKIDALPGKSFTGKVSQKAILPSSENSWLNPDLKVFDVKVSFDDPGKDLRPGMTATVEIQVNHLEDVLFVPIQAVQTDAKGRHFCFLEDGTKRELKLAQRSRTFVVVTEGVSEGDRVQMVPPELPPANENEDEEEEEENAGKDKAAPKASQKPAEGSKS